MLERDEQAIYRRRACGRSVGVFGGMVAIVGPCGTQALLCSQPAASRSRTKGVAPRNLLSDSKLQARSLRQQSYRYLAIGMLDAMLATTEEARASKDR